VLLLPQSVHAKVASCHLLAPVTNPESTRRPRSGVIPSRNKSIQAGSCGEHLKICPENLTSYNFCYESQAKDAHVGVVKNYSPPQTPKAPVLPANLASEIAAYDAAEPTIADAVAAPTISSEDAGSGGGAEAYLTFLEQDLPKPVHHH
jgi:ATP synthase complex subunit h